MNWEVHLGMLDRQRAQLEAKAKSETFGPLLEKVINDGTNLCNDVITAFPPKDITLVSISLYRQILTMLDAMHVLLLGGVVEPCELHLRSSLEVLAGLTFILQKEADFRSRCFLYHYFKEYRKQCEFFLSNADEKASPEKARIIKEGAAKRIFEINKQLESGIFDNVIKEVEKLPRHLKRQWFSACGPESLKHLCDECGLSEIHALYHSWSLTVHGKGVLDYVELRDGENFSCSPIRRTETIGPTAGLAITMGINATLVVLNFFRPEKQQEYVRWLTDEVRPALKELMAGFI